jgi:hypothetical protein
MVRSLSDECNKELNSSPQIMKKLCSLNASLDKKLDKYENVVKQAMKVNDWQTFQPRKLSIKREQDKVDCIGYILADHKRPTTTY